LQRTMPYAAGWARYHLLLGKLEQEEGNESRAAGEYERFRAMWRQADPERPELAEAPAR